MSDQSRRKLLKSIAAGSGAIVAGKSLPESWSRSIVDSVVLPAHAQTSCGTLTITRITQPSEVGQGTFVYPCGTTTFVTNFNFNFNVAPVTPVGRRITLTSGGCATALPAVVDGSGNATMAVDLSSCASGLNTLVFSIECGSSVSCAVDLA